jgi:hypothetical protein
MSSYRGDSRGQGGRGGPPPRGGRPGGPPNKGDPYRTGPLDVIVNCFRVTRLPTQTYYHYDGQCICDSRLVLISHHIYRNSP